MGRFALGLVLGTRFAVFRLVLAGYYTQGHTEPSGFVARPPSLGQLCYPLPLVLPVRWYVALLTT